MVQPESSRRNCLYKLMNLATKASRWKMGLLPCCMRCSCAGHRRTKSRTTHVRTGHTQATANVRGARTYVGGRLLDDGGLELPVQPLHQLERQRLRSRRRARARILGQHDRRVIVTGRRPTSPHLEHDRGRDAVNEELVELRAHLQQPGDGPPRAHGHAAHGQPRRLAPALPTQGRTAGGSARPRCWRRPAACTAASPAARSVASR